jgi:predicted DNA-binding transcriptional regulator AlpA
MQVTAAAMTTLKAGLEAESLRQLVLPKSKSTRPNENSPTEYVHAEMYLHETAFSRKAAYRWRLVMCLPKPKSWGGGAVDWTTL